MDNGLIFPYPCLRARGEPRDAHRLKRLVAPPFGVVAWGVERGNRTGSSQAMG
jgi:hypothetical protein